MTTSAGIAVRQFLGWWSSCLAEVASGLLPGRRRVAVISVTSPSDPQAAIPAGLSPDDGVALSLGPDAALVHHRQYDFDLVAAVPDLLPAEINRLTPFEKDDVYIAHEISGYDWKKKRITVTFAVVRRDFLSRIFRQLQERGLTPLYAVPEGMERLRFSELPSPTGEDGRATFAGLKFWSAFAVVAFSAALIVPTLRMAEVSERLDARLESLQRDVGQGADVMNRAATIKRTMSLLERHRTGYQSKLEMLSELSRVMPADSWLVSIDVSGDRVRLSGFAAVPSEVVSALTGSSRFSEIQYRSAGARDGGTGAERFELEAVLVSGAEGS